MESRPLTDKDYEVLCEWWKWNRFPAPSKSILPNEALGGIMVIDKNGTNLCSGFIYYTNSSLCWLEMIVANPEIKDRKIRNQAMVLLIKSLCEEAKEKGVLAVFSSINTLKQKNLIECYIEAGFVASSSATTELIIKL